jgi:tRNA nucleotidyltransferase (CCA-adding enzyme)
VKLIVTHQKPDFDALASLALARLVHPGAKLAVTGSLESQLEAFIHLYRDQLELIDASQVNLDEVRELIVVDTSDPARLGPFESLVGRVGVTLYDHHPRPEAPIPAARGRQQPLGATASILTLLLKSKGIVIPPEIASLALLGIHEDTGHLSYASTTPEDHEACAHLLRMGANLQLVSEFSREPLKDEHQAFLGKLLDVARSVEVQGFTVVTASLEREEYLPEIAPLCNQLLELHGADAALIVAAMEGKTMLIARARGDGIDVGAALQEVFGGGGHKSAAFAKSDAGLEESLARALEAFSRHARQGERAETLMSAPVKTVRDKASVAEAQALLLKYGHNGLPVVDEAGKLVGIISRRDLERALRHELGSAKVRGFMSKGVVTAAPTASLRELERLIEQHNVGRIPIVQGGNLVGIVTRSDLLRARHRPRLVLSPSEAKARAVLDTLPPAAHEALEVAREVLGAGRLYLVGGTVRDALLGIGMQDLDIVIEHVPAERFTSALQQRLGGKLSCHFEFGTCTLILPSGLVIDVATAREEFYRHPGALPDVTPSTLAKDLARRDFTVNALAVAVAPGAPHLIDPYGGLADLERRVLKPLHALSFVEDATRILRGARLAGRLGFRFHDDALNQIDVALHPRLLAKLSASRLRAELLLTLAEPRVAPALEHLERCGALKAMFGYRVEPTLAQLDAERQRREIPDESYLLALLLSLPEREVEAHRQRFHWASRLIDTRRRLAEVRQSRLLSLEAFESLSEAAREVVRALGDDLALQLVRYETLPKRPKLRGQDVLDLGLAPGPAVGDVLEAVAEARARGEVKSYHEELELARALVDAHLATPSQE